MGDGKKNVNIGMEMVDERRRLKPMVVKKYGEFKVFKPFAYSSLYLHLHPLVSL